MAAASSDVHDDYVTEVFGIDPRRYGLQPVGAQPAPPPAGAVIGAVTGAATGGTAPPPTAKQAEVTKAADQVAKLSDADLHKLPTKDKVALLTALLADGQPTGAALAAQKKIYLDTDLDPAFKAADDAHSDNIAKVFKGDKALEAARDGWSKASEADKIATLKTVVAAQSKEYGFTPPEIVIVHEPAHNRLITNGFFDPSDGKLHLNMDPDSSVQQFEKAVDLALHENAHNYQDHLVKQLKAGKIKPGDTNYDQATLFAANDAAGGYVTAQSPADLPAYRAQPLERHSWHTGPDTAAKIMTQM